MSLLGATILTAIATLALAVFAFTTAIFAWLAFRKQSREVAAIEQQVKDEQEVTRQQAELLKVQTGQLEVLRAQLDDQRKASAAQAEVLELQAAELRESLDERKREAERRRTAQAAMVFLTEDHFRNTSNMRMTAIASVRNASDLPVYDAELLWRHGSAGWGEPNPEPIGVILPGEGARYLREYSEDTNMGVSGAILRFTDAAGVRWVRRADGYLGEHYLGEQD